MSPTELARSMLRRKILDVVSRAWVLTPPIETYEIGIDFDGRHFTVVRAQGDTRISWSLYEGASLLAGPLMGSSAEDIATRLEAGVALAGPPVVQQPAGSFSTGTKVAIGAGVLLGVIGLVWWASK